VSLVIHTRAFPSYKSRNIIYRNHKRASPEHSNAGLKGYSPQDLGLIPINSNKNEIKICKCVIYICILYCLCYKYILFPYDKLHFNIGYYYKIWPVKINAA